MFNNRIFKAGVGVCLTASLFLTACDGDGKEKNNPTPQELVALAKKDIAETKYADAIQKCDQAEQMDDSYDEAKYCILAANLGAMVQSVANIIGLIASQVGDAPPEYRKNINVKQIVGSVLSDIEAQMAYIDLYAYKLTAMENPHFQIDDFPLSLDPTDLLKLVGTDEIKVEGDIALNMRGTWDKSEAVVLGASMNAVQGVLDYLLAHKLVLDSTDIDFDSTEGIANFLYANPELLIGDTGDESRIKGDDNRKGLKLDVLAALSFLVGRDSDLERVSPAHGGLTEAIKASAEEAAPDAVVKWVDADKDGIPEEIGLPALNDLKDKIKDADGNPIIEEDTFANPLDKATWDEIIKLGVAVRDNVEADGGDVIALKPVLEALRVDIKDEESTTRILFKEVPNLLGINPGAMFAAPKYISELIPYYYHFTYGSQTTQHADIAFEIEQYYAAGLTYGNEKSGVEYRSDFDFAHFDYTAVDTNYDDATYTFDAFPDVTLADIDIAADNVLPDAKSTQLYYIGLQDPTIGGLLQGDMTLAGTFAPITSFDFNAGLNRLIKYYCLDIGYNFDEDTYGALAVFDNDAYPAGNKIDACTQAF